MKALHKVGLLVAYAVTIGAPPTLNAMAASVPRSRSHVVLTHSHNDYERRHPLKDALQQGFSSVEADVWLRGNDIAVSHLSWFGRGSLTELYLKPLQELVNTRGSVDGTGETFYLWLDIKDASHALVEKLESVLATYPMFTEFSRNGVVKKGPVVAILTGDEQSKATYMQEFPVRHAIRDNTDFQTTPYDSGDSWSWYSLAWGDYFSWNGSGEMPQDERQRFAELVSRIHAQGRKVRFWDTPETQEFWHEAIEAKVDMLGTDELPAVAQFVENLEPTVCDAR